MKHDPQESEKQKHPEEEFEREEDEIFEHDDVSSEEVIRNVKQALKECKRERQEYLAGWQRAQADLINERKEMEQRISRIEDVVAERLLTDLLPVLDSFDMAFQNKDAWEKVDKNWRMGVEHIHSNFLSILAEHGITSFNPIGELFDPERHESLETVTVDEQKDENTVVEVLQRGYERNKNVIRAAKVKVGMHKVS
jgi:molecular chaperone GrpE